MAGVTSIGRQTVPVSSSTTLVWRGSLQVTVADLLTIPLNPPELNCRGIAPVLPGWMRRSQAPAVVQPQLGVTSVISRVAEPVLVRTKRCLTTSPGFTLPKSKTVEPNPILGSDLCSVFSALRSASGNLA